MPKASRDVFTLLENSNILSVKISEQIKKWLGLGILLFMIIKIFHLMW